MEVDVSMTRQIEHPLRDDAAVADHDDCIRVDARKLSAEFVVGLDSIGLGNRKTQLLRGLFNRGRNEFEASPLRAIWLGDDKMDTVA